MRSLVVHMICYLLAGNDARAFVLLSQLRTRAQSLPYEQPKGPSQRFIDCTRVEVKVLSILDDHSRAVLATVVAATE